MPGYFYAYNNVKKPSGGSVNIFTDSDAESYYNALVTANGGDDINAQVIYSISLDTLKTAINTFFVDLKVDSTYTEMVNMFPMIGGTSACHAINAVNATSEITWSSSPSHTGNGVVMDGIDDYGDLGNVPSESLTNNDYHISQYVFSSNSQNAIGSRQGTNDEFAFKFLSPDFNFLLGRTVNYAISEAEINNFIIATRTASNHFIAFSDGNSIVTDSNNNTEILPYRPTFIGAWNVAGGDQSNVQGDIKFVSLGGGLTNTQAATLNTSVKTLNQSLGREYEFTDPSASAYWNTLSLVNSGSVDCPTIYNVTNATVMEAIDDFFISLKADTTYDKMKGMWLFIGGTNNTHAVNAYDLDIGGTYPNSPINSSAGLRTNGGGSYLNTGQSPSSLGVLSGSNHISYFAETYNGIVAVGDRSGTGQALFIRSQVGNEIDWVSNENSKPLTYTTSSLDDVNQVLIGSRRSLTDSEFYIDGVGKISSSVENTGVMSTANHNIGEVIGVDSRGEIKSSTIGLGLSDTEAATLTTALKNLDTAIRVNVNYVFTNDEARDYYDELERQANGSIDSMGLYGLTQKELKTAIDVFYTSIKADSTYDEINEMYLYIGGDANTHAVSGVTATSTLTYTGSPTHGAAGLNLNGTTQYAVLPNIANTYTTTNDSHMSIFMETTNDAVAIGSRATSGTETWIRCQAGPLLEWSAHRASAGSGYATYSATTAELQKVVVGSITASTSVKLYIDGSEVADGGTNTGLVDSTYQPYIGAINLAGNPNGISAGDVKFSSIGTGLTSTQVTTLTNAVKTLNTTLGR